MKFGHTTASLLIAKLHASSRQSTLAKALHEYGRLIRSIYVCRYVADEELRRRVRRQLNKGESLHALRRDLFFAHQGHVRRRHLDEQIDQALCLTLVTNACVLWTTTYLGDTIDALRADGVEVTDEMAAHLTPRTTRQCEGSDLGGCQVDVRGGAQRGNLVRAAGLRDTRRPSSTAWSRHIFSTE
jgi:Tn3 transposase DDE domain